MEISIQDICAYATCKVRLAKSQDIRLKHGENCIVLFDIGDYYEAYGDSANDLGDVLYQHVEDDRGTAKFLLLKNKDYVYLPKLIKAGYKVCITEE